MGTYRIIAALALALGVFSTARAGNTGQAPRLHSCVVIHQTGSPAWRSDRDACATRLSPASTFKIPHALVGLETGTIAMGTLEKWDGTTHPDQPRWDADHTVLTAMRPSVLWYFQRMAPRIGAARMHDWLRQLNYGNADTSGDVTQYWINGRLRISADEQVVFLAKFFAGTLPFQEPHQRAIGDALAQKPGTVENARGVHAVDGSWTRAALTAKTGATTTDDRQGTSWLVGALNVRGQPHVFASVVWRNDGGVDSFDGARLAVKAFVARGLLPPSAGVELGEGPTFARANPK